MSNQFNQETSESEISLTEITNFLKESWKAIIATGIVGVVAAVAFLIVTPSQYEAIVQLQMGQINLTNTNPMGNNIESPSVMIGRHQIPSTYTVDEIKACGIEGKELPNEYLMKMVKITPVKGSDSVVELKIKLDSKDRVFLCTQAVFQNIRESQGLVIKPYVEEAKNLLVKYQDRLQEAQASVTRVEKSGSALSAVYLSNRDEVKFLIDEILRLNALIASADTRQAKLVTPIYVSDSPVSPKKSVSLVLGLLAGLFVGLLLVLLRRAWNNYKASNE